MVSAYGEEERDVVVDGEYLLMVGRFPILPGLSRCDEPRHVCHLPSQQISVGFDWMGRHSRNGDIIVRASLTTIRHSLYFRPYESNLIPS